MLEIYQGQAVMALTPELRWSKVAMNIVRHRTEGRLPEPPPSDFGAIPFDRMTAAWVYDENRGEFKEVSGRLRDWRRESNALVGDRPVDLLAGNLMPHALEVDLDRRTLRALGADPYLTILPPIRDPLGSELLLEARVTLEPPSADSKNFACLYWSSAGSRKFSEQKKLVFLLPQDGKYHQVRIPLGSIIPLLADRPLYSLRLDFTPGPATVEVKKLILQPAVPPG